MKFRNGIDLRDKDILKLTFYLKTYLVSIRESKFRAPDTTSPPTMDDLLRKTLSFSVPTSISLLKISGVLRIDGSAN